MGDTQEENKRASWGPFAQAVVLLVLEAAAIVFGVSCLLLGDALLPVLTSNQFPEGFREKLMLTFVAASGLAAAGGVLGAKFLCVARLRTWAGLLAPVIPLGLIPVLLESEYWFTRQWEFLITLAVAVLITEASFRSFFSRVEPWAKARTWPAWLKRASTSKRAPLVTICLVSVLYTCVSAWLTMMDHWRFGTGAFDLGIFDNMMFNAMHGTPFRSSLMYGGGPGNSLAGHAEFGMLFFVPIYAIYPSSEMMLCLQAAALGLAGIPLYLFASTQISRWRSVLLSSAYFLFTPIHGAQYYDFHWLTMSVPFVFLLFYGVAAKKKRIVVPTAIFLFLLREDMAPGVAMLGLFLLITGARPKFGAGLAVAAIAWFPLVKFVIMPYFGTWFFADLYNGLMIPGERGYGSVIKTLISNPAFVFQTISTTPKLLFALHLLVPLAFLPARRAILLLLLVPGALFSIVTSWPASFTIQYHYTSHFTPYLFGASAVMLGILHHGTWRRRADVTGNRTDVTGNRSGHALAALVALCFGIACHSTNYGMILKPSSFIGGIQPVSYTMTEKEKTRLSNLEELIAKIPPNASVTATDFDAPHLSNRQYIFAIGQRIDIGEYLLLAPHSFHLAQTKPNIRRLMEARPYGFVARAGEHTLWKIGAESPKTKEEKAKLYRQIGGVRPVARPTAPPAGRSGATKYTKGKKKTAAPKKATPRPASK